MKPKSSVWKTCGKMGLVQSVALNEMSASSDQYVYAHTRHSHTPMLSLTWAHTERLRSQYTVTLQRQDTRALTFYFIFSHVIITLQEKVRERDSTITALESTVKVCVCVCACMCVYAKVHFQIHLKNFLSSK
jgi:hypothetical protein